MERPAIAPQPHGGHPHQPHSQRPQLCRFYGTKAGCRAGDSCRYIHDASKADQGSRPAQPHGVPASESATETQSQPPPQTPPQTRRYNAPPVDGSRVVQRPVPQAQLQDPREFQLSQLRRRFSPAEETTPGGTSLSIKLVPSDPDFPYEIDVLDFVLRVPLSYPSGKPSIRVNNREMGRGYQINIEKGFDEMLGHFPNRTLLHQMNALDKQLESLLAAPKAETIKLISNVAKAPQPADFSTQLQSKSQSMDDTQHPISTAQPIALKGPITYSDEQKVQAKNKRDSETRQLEARLGRLPQFNRSSNGLEYTVPIEPRKRNELPTEIQAVKLVRLSVPLIYNLEPCSIELVGVSREHAKDTEKCFKDRALQNPELSLLSLINYMTQNLHIMASKPKEDISIDALDSLPGLTLSENSKKESGLRGQTSASTSSDLIFSGALGDKSHIVTIPRPPEWSVQDDEGSDDSFSYDSEIDTEDDSDDSHEGEEDAPRPPTAERGISISFPFLELHGIELLELVNVNLTIKCDRCKDTLDISNIKNNTKGDYSGIRSESCKKCVNPLGIGYRMDLMHSNSVRAGYLDLDGCVVVDLLPSNFIPTCSECSTPGPAPGVVSVRGESSFAICRECHRRMSFRIPEVKFLLVSASAARSDRAPPRKKAKEKLGIIAGQELPKRGRCKHYSKSYRWFRFSCCSKVFPCDRCHDDASDHPNEHANRMICGLCSREQNYRPEDCGVCHSALTGRTSTGFWEGGKGTRDKTRMSRKDPRKYKRRPGTKPKS